MSVLLSLGSLHMVCTTRGLLPDSRQLWFLNRRLNNLIRSKIVFHYFSFRTQMQLVSKRIKLILRDIKKKEADIHTCCIHCKYLMKENRRYGLSQTTSSLVCVVLIFYLQSSRWFCCSCRYCSFLCHSHTS